MLQFQHMFLNIIVEIFYGNIEVFVLYYFRNIVKICYFTILLPIKAFDLDLEMQKVFCGKDDGSVRAQQGIKRLVTMATIDR